MEKRLPLSVQVVVYRRIPGNKVLVLGLRRAVESKIWWQPVTGGVIKGETLEDAAFRETLEETGLTEPVRFHNIDYAHSYRINRRYRKYYDDDITVKKEYAFGWETDAEEIKLSGEHIDYRWLSPGEAVERFRYRGNKEVVRQLIKQLEDET